MKEENPRIRAYWDNNFRHSCYMGGANWHVETYDRFVQGESVEVLKQECRAKIDDENYYIEHGCTKSDRYGSVYPDNEARRWAMGRRDARQRVLDKLEAGTFGPPYTIELGEDGWDITTVRKFTERKHDD